MATQNLTKINIRRAQTSDLDGLTRLITPFVDEGKLLPRTHSEMAGLLPNMFVADVEGEIVGCAALEIYSPKLAEIRSLAVSAAAQGMGIGKLLVQACVEYAREQHVLEVMAITSSDNFFMACGFDYTLPGEKKALFIQTRDEV
jgi:amino-acid N-acetyltransferase